MTAGGFFVSNRLKSADEPFVGLSAKIVSLATDVEAVDFLGQVPYQLLFDFNCDKFRQTHKHKTIEQILTCFLGLSSGFPDINGVAESSSVLAAL